LVTAADRAHPTPAQLGYSSRSTCGHSISVPGILLFFLGFVLLFLAALYFCCRFLYGKCRAEDVEDAAPLESIGNITVNTITGQSACITVTVETTLGELKLRIAVQLGIPVHEQRLVFASNNEDVDGTLGPRQLVRGLVDAHLIDRGGGSVSGGRHEHILEVNPSSVRSETKWTRDWPAIRRRRD
jgi:hypothetical protein